VGLELEDARAAHQGVIDREERVGCGSANEDDGAILDIGQQRVLLGFVEAVNLVDEQQRALALAFEGVACFGEHVADVFHAAGDGIELAEPGAGLTREQVGERGLSRAGRTVENHCRQAVGLDEASQQLSFAQEVLLTDELIQRARPHAAGERLGLAAVIALLGGEEGHGNGERGDGKQGILHK
jgi:hypothetical protein